jgi:hypothetical protein
MRSFPTSAPGAARFGGGILLALALCACGGAGDADDARGAGSAESSASAVLASGDSCPAPPTVDPERFKGKWATLSNYIVHELGATFPNEVLPDSNTQAVKLCPNCDRVEMTILPEANTRCTPPDSLNGRPRIMGILVLKNTFTGSDSTGWETIQKNDSVFMFASSTDGRATMVYPNERGQVVVAPDTSWMFYYCQDTHQRSGRPEAKWRPRNVPVPASPSAGKGKGKDREDDDDGGTYGWMACVSGCCQFYTPPPNPTVILTSDRANPQAPDTVGRGRNQAPGKRPTWCPPQLTGPVP